MQHCSYLGCSLISDQYVSQASICTLCQYIYVVCNSWQNILNELPFNAVIKVAHAEVVVYGMYNAPVCLVQNCKYSIRLKYIGTQGRWIRYVLMMHICLFCKESKKMQDHENKCQILKM